jgi:hypothetical protein
MTNADEPFGQDMGQEPADEVVGGQSHDLGPMVIGIKIMPHFSVDFRVVKGRDNGPQ